jgi:hypothetical protein
MCLFLKNFFFFFNKLALKPKTLMKSIFYQKKSKMKPETINLKYALTRSTTKKLKRWVELVSELLALSTKQNMKKQMIFIKKLKTKQI